MTGYTRNWRVTDRRPHHEGEIEYPFAIEHTEPGTSAVMPIADICRQPDAEQSARLISAAPDMLEAHYENVRCLTMLLNELQGRVEAGKLAVIQTAINRSIDVIAKAEDRK